jgi:hypothetical protein
VRASATKAVDGKAEAKVRQALLGSMHVRESMHYVLHSRTRQYGQRSQRASRAARYIAQLYVHALLSHTYKSQTHTHIPTQVFAHTYAFCKCSVSAVAFCAGRLTD